ncbi:MAG: hypothetical protein ACOCVF_00570 [bacterium]
MKQHELAKIFHVDQSHISDIVNNKKRIILYKNE